MLYVVFWEVDNCSGSSFTVDVKKTCEALQRAGYKITGTKRA